MTNAGMKVGTWSGRHLIIRIFPGVPAVTGNKDGGINAEPTVKDGHLINAPATCIMAYNARS